MKIKIKEAYLLVLIVTGLMFTAIYSTYALFTKEVTLDNVVSFNTTISLSDSNLIEYELVTLNPNESKKIELRINNSSASTLYYGCWYELLTNNASISIGQDARTLVNGVITTTGTISTSENKTIVIGITNNGSSTVLVNLGVVGNTTSNLGLSSGRNIITDSWQDAIIVDDAYLNDHTTSTTEDVNLEYTNPQRYEVTLSPGTYLLETWGAEGNGNVETCTAENDDGETIEENIYNAGGKGGYSKGTLTLANETMAYVYVGGSGKNTEKYTDYNNSYYIGGFNGGGSAESMAGGGASDIRLGADSLYARVIVAGGGGGGAAPPICLRVGITGGSGGGLLGNEGDKNPGSSFYYYGGGGGTQTSSGNDVVNDWSSSCKGTIKRSSNFGNGGSGHTSGGGGGWYGGGLSCKGGGGGGSGYVYTSSTSTNYPTGVLLNSNYYLTNAETIAGNTRFIDFNGSTVIGRSGNGAVKITGTATITKYSIPVIKGLKNLTVLASEPKSLTEGITYECENGGNSCTYIGPDVTNTSSLSLGTHTVTYKIRSASNALYLYQITVRVVNEYPANDPVLTDALIPVTYNSSSSTWVKADSTNNNNSWYNYDNKIWANAVLVSSTNRSTYQSASPGTTIASADILAFYVWIPRYKYKVWNINKVIGTDSYNAQTTGIDIVFESGTDSSGTISCTYSYASSTVNNPNEKCIGSNGDYYTHPAFTFGNQELTGFWMGKFELSSSNPATGSSYGGGNSTILTPRILPNVTSWRYNTISNYWKVIYDMQTSNNIYGLPTLRMNADSHMITNMEWGAVAYLTNSKYGRCTNGSCTELSINGYGETSNMTTKTGCGPISNGSTSYSTTCNAYNTILGQTASTTGNITGVYDMSGGASEYAMGNMSNSNGTTYTYNASDAGSNFTYSADIAKYLTQYAYGTTYNDQTAYNRGRLGDSTSEVVLFRRGDGGWNGDYSRFPYLSTSWFLRGGVFNNGNYAGSFYFYDRNGGTYPDYSTRAILSVWS